MTFISVGFHSIILKPCEENVRTLPKFFNSQICIWWRRIRSITITLAGNIYIIYKRKRSYVKILKSNGPRMAPWGTTNTISSHELYLSFIMNLCFLPHRQYNKYRSILVISYKNHKHVILQWANYVKGNQTLLANLLILPQNCLPYLHFFPLIDKHYWTLLRAESFSASTLIFW